MPKENSKENGEKKDFGIHERKIFQSSIKLYNLTEEEISALGLA